MAGHRDGPATCAVDLDVTDVLQQHVGYCAFDAEAADFKDDRLALFIRETETERSQQIEAL